MDDHDALDPLGFTSNESSVYMRLLRTGPQTGYGLAKAMGRAPAQVYSTLEALSRKGAVVAQSGEPRVWRSVEPPVLLAQLEVEFRESAERARDRLDRIVPEAPQQGIYRLTSPEQVYARVRQVLGHATSAVLVDCFPEPYGELEEALGAAAGRGIAVALKGYGPVDVPGAWVVVAPNAGELLRDVEGQILHCVADGRQLVSAFFTDRGQVRSAFWTGNPLLVGLSHNGLVSELGLTRLLELLESDPGEADLRAVYPGLAPFLWRSSPGFQELRRGG
jgi:sugar-specific transcriptional regulator TrmB